jgi:hypothetical protein
MSLQLNESSHRSVRYSARLTASMFSLFPWAQTGNVFALCSWPNEFRRWITMCVLWPSVICEFWCTIASQILSVGIVFLAILCSCRRSWCESKREADVVYMLQIFWRVAVAFWWVGSAGECSIDRLITTSKLAGYSSTTIGFIRNSATLPWSLRSVALSTPNT